MSGSLLPEGLPSPGVQDVHLWFCSLNRVLNSDDFKRRVLSHYLTEAPAELQFVLGEHGKPALTGATGALDFNLSHSGDWLACAVTAGTPVGVDLEFCKPKRDVMKLARRFYREDEASALQTYSESEQRSRFYDLWTLKESAVKARGEALVPGLLSYGFDITFPRKLETVSASDSQHEAGRIVVTTDNAAEKAHYYLLEPLPQYRLAMCCLSHPLSPPQLRVVELGAAGAVTEIHLPLRARTWFASAVD